MDGNARIFSTQTRTPTTISGQREYSSPFVHARLYLEEFDFSIISALKSQVSPRIAGHCIMHSKIGSHFSFSLTHVCHIYRVVLIVGTFCVGRCTRIQQQSNNMNTQFVVASLWRP